MQKQLINTEKQLTKSQTGILGRANTLTSKLTEIVENSKDKTKDKEYLNPDLFAQMTYMAAISSSGLARNQIFNNAAQLPYSSSSYFKDITSMVQRLNYDYPEACRIVGEKTMEPEPRAILLRMAGTLMAGEPEHIFLAREAHVQGETYGNAYERDLQTLKSWTDAYVSLLLSASLIVIVAVISMMIYPVQNSFLFLLTGLTILVSVAGAWVIHRAAPKEIKTHSLPETSRGQSLARMLFRLTVPVGVFICCVLAWMNVDLGLILLLGSAIVLPPGLLIVWDDQKIDKHDHDIAGVLRSLGGAAKAMGSTVSHAVSAIDLRSTASLQGSLKRLKTRLITDINPDLCWSKFASETGSEHVHRSVQIFRDAVEMGADPQVAGEQSSLYAMKITLLRAKRKLVSSGFSWLCILMHATVCALMLFICGVLKVFSGALEGMEELNAVEGSSNLPTFGFFGETTQLQLFGNMVTIVILIFTVSNAFAIRAAYGGHHYKFLFYFGILMAISGISFLIVPHIVNTMLGTMAPMM